MYESKNYVYIDELRTMVETSQFVTSLISESWIKQTSFKRRDKNVELYGYDIFRNDRTGGVAVYVNSHFPTPALHCSENSRTRQPE